MSRFDCVKTMHRSTFLNVSRNFALHCTFLCILGDPTLFFFIKITKLHRETFSPISDILKKFLFHFLRDSNITHIYYISIFTGDWYDICRCTFPTITVLNSAAFIRTNKHVTLRISSQLCLSSVHSHKIELSLYLCAERIYVEHSGGGMK